MRIPGKKEIYACPVCGNRFPVWRLTAGRRLRQRKKGHQKMLFCWKCDGAREFVRIG